MPRVSVLIKGNEALVRLNSLFYIIYADSGCDSIAPRN